MCKKRDPAETQSGSGDRGGRQFVRPAMAAPSSGASSTDVIS